MPIGPITPGAYVTVTPDPSVAKYLSAVAPTATMPVIASDIQNLTLMVLNVNKMSVDGVGGGFYTPSTEIQIGPPGGLGVYGNFRLFGTGTGQVSFGSVWTIFGEERIDFGGVWNVKSGGIANVQSSGAFHVQNGGVETIDSGGSFIVAAGGGVTVQSAGQITLNNGASCIANTGSTVTCNGTVNLGAGISTCHTTIGGSASDLTVANTCAIIVNSGAQIAVAAGGLININSGGLYQNAGIFQNLSAGVIQRRLVKMVVGSNLTTGPITADVVLVPVGQTAGHTMAVQDGPVSAGSIRELRIYSASVNTVAVSGTGISFNLSALTSGEFRWVDLIWDGATWFLSGSFLNP